MSKPPPIEDFADLAFDPFTAQALSFPESAMLDPYPEIARLRRQGKAWKGNYRSQCGYTPDLTLRHLQHYAILGYDGVNEVLNDPGLYSSTISKLNIGVAFGRSVTTMDPPEHSGFRKLFQKAFMRPVIQHWADELIPGVVNRIIDEFASTGRAELVSQFTRKFPFHLIYELIGLPADDREIFHRLAVGQTAIIYDAVHGHDAIGKLKPYLTALVQSRREHPLSSTDMVSILANAEVDGERIPDEVAIAFFRQLMNAGGDTSYHGTGSIFTGLLTHPEQLQAVRAKRELVPAAIEEGLRWNAPVMAIFRTPTREVEFGGHVLHPGDCLDVLLGSANRDEAAFENPDRFDVSRPQRRSNAFGFGPHVCIGQHLARLEVGIAINAILDRLPNLRLDPDYPPPKVVGIGTRGPEAIHVRFD
jgi:cytochrome P450